MYFIISDLDDIVNSLSKKEKGEMPDLSRNVAKSYYFNRLAKNVQKGVDIYQ
ncbi:MAG: hypothetical protein K0R00_2982 [Herbinix sp.]|jgi:hypothetical protein|nr:hypothetical protein [Herbinix sp.]